MSQIYSSSLQNIYVFKFHDRKYSGQKVNYPCLALLLLVISSLASYAQLFALSAQLSTLPAQLSPLSAQLLMLMLGAEQRVERAELRVQRAEHKMPKS